MFVKLLTIIIVIIISIFITVNYIICGNNRETKEGVTLKGGEDMYHEELGKNNLFYAYFKVKINNKNNILRFIDKIKIYHYNFYKNTDIHPKIKYNEIAIEVEKINIKEMYEKNCSDIITLKIFYSLITNEILVLINHTYVGGFFFLECLIFASNAKKVKPYELIYKPILTELNCAYFLIKDGIPILNRKLKWKTNCNEKNVKICSFKFDIKQIKKYYPNENIRSCIIFYLTHIIFNHMSIDLETLHILLPIGFKPKKGIYNNVGCIIINLNKYDTVQSINKKIIDNKYQASATNYLMQMVNKNKTVRQSINCVFTIGNISNGTIIDQFETIEISGPYPSPYNIYTACFTYNEVCHCSMTIMSEDFLYDKLLKTKGIYKSLYT